MILKNTEKKRANIIEYSVCYTVTLVSDYFEATTFVSVNSWRQFVLLKPVLAFLLCFCCQLIDDLSNMRQLITWCISWQLLKKIR